MRVLGGLSVDGVADLGARKARTLFKVLALGRGVHVPADSLVDALWGDALPAKPLDQLSVLVSRLRAIVSPDRLTRSDAGYALRVDWLDLDALAELVEEAERRARVSPVTARAAAVAALALVRGPLLPDEPSAEWARADRALADRLDARARHAAAGAALAGGDWPAAAEFAQGALARDPYDEVALGLAMIAFDRAGRPASALSLYAEMRSRLTNDLGVDPTPATEALHTGILLAESPPPALDAVDGVDAVHAAPRALPGRAAAFAVLDDALVAGGLVIVKGEAGMGKTALLAAWSARIGAEGICVLAGRCEELGRGLPLQPVMDALDRHLRALDPGETARVLGADVSVLGPVLGRTPLDDAGSVAALVDQSAGQSLLFGALLAVLLRIAEEGPVVLALDDLHLAGSLTMEWLHFIARRGPWPRLLVVAAQREEEGFDFPTAVELRIGPLDIEAAAHIVGSERSRDLHARSGGHPLFLVELAAAEPDQLPDSIREAVVARSARAGPAADTLRTAAVLGPDIDLDMLADVLRLSGVTVLDHLEEGVRRRLLIDEGNSFRFGHELLREALVADVSSARRALLHREAGRMLARRPRADWLAIAHHAQLGGDVEVAAAALADAALVAQAGYDYAEAERLLDIAIGLDDNARARIARAQVRMLLDNNSAAADDASAARAMGAGARAFELGAWAGHFQKDYATAIALADEGARIASTGDGVGRAECLAIGGWVRAVVGDVAGAGVRLQEAVDVADDESRPVASIWLGGLRILEGDIDEGLELVDRGTTQPIGPWHSHPGLYGLMFRAIGLGRAGRAEEALSALDAFDADAARSGSTRFLGRADNLRGWVVRNLGAFDEADELNLRSREATAALELIEPLCHAHADLASGAVMLGRFDAAAGHLADHDRDADRPHSLRWRHVQRASLLRARIALGEERWDEAEAEAIHLLDEVTLLGIRRYGVLARAVIAEARLRRGDSIDHDEVGALLEALPHQAGLEAWWVTGSVAIAAGNDPWIRLAERQASDLAGRAVRHRDTLLREASLRLRLR